MLLLKRWYQRHFTNPQVTVLAICLIAIFCIVLFMGQMLLPALVSLVIAYLLDGIVSTLQKRGTPRIAAVLGVYLVFLTAYAFVLFGLIPLMLDQVRNAWEELPTLASSASDGIETLLVKLSVPEEERLAILEQFSKIPMPENAQKDVLAFALSSFRALVVTLVYAILTPILVFFMLRDKERIQAWILRFVPKERKLVGQVWHEVDLQIGNYVRGKAWEILIVGGITFFVFTVLGLKYSLLLSIAVGLSVVVPYVGATLVTFPILMVAFSQWGFEEPQFYYVLGAYAVIQAFDGNLLVPLIFSEAVNLHPIAIILAVIVFGGIWGIWGVIFAIPLATLVQAIIKAWPQPDADGMAPPGSGEPEAAKAEPIETQ